MPSHGSFSGLFKQMITSIFGAPTNTGLKVNGTKIVYYADVVFHGKTIRVNLKALPRSRWCAWTPSASAAAQSTVSTEDTHEDALKGLKTKLEQRYGQQRQHHGPVQQPRGGSTAPTKGTVKPWVPPVTLHPKHKPKPKPKQTTLPVVGGPKPGSEPMPAYKSLAPKMPKLTEGQVRSALEQAGFKDVRGVEPWESGNTSGFEIRVWMWEETRIILAWRNHGWQATAPSEDKTSKPGNLDTPLVSVLRDLYNKLMG